MHRRSFLIGLTSTIIAAPAVVKAASLMPVSAQWVRRSGSTFVRYLTPAEVMALHERQMIENAFDASISEMASKFNGAMGKTLIAKHMR